MGEKIDIVIPLGNGSKFNNDELRFALRSIERNVPNADEIFLLTAYAPEWAQDINIIPVQDYFGNNKDANLFNKVLVAALDPNISDDFLIWSDDQVALNPIDTDNLDIWNHRNRNSFLSMKRWHQRMLHTLDYLASIGYHLNFNWDSHTPHKHNRFDIISTLSSVDYASQPGFCLDTLLLGSAKREPKIEQNLVKITAEANTPTGGWGLANTTKLFLGYNDNSFQTGLKEELLTVFPDKSRWEKDNIIAPPKTPQVTVVNAEPIKQKNVKVVMFYRGDDIIPLMVSAYSFKKHSGFDTTMVLYADTPTINKFPEVTKIFDTVHNADNIISFLENSFLKEYIPGIYQDFPRIVNCWAKHIAWLEEEVPENGYSIGLDYDTICRRDMRGILPTGEQTWAGYPAGKRINGRKPSVNGGIVVISDKFDKKDVFMECLHDKKKYDAVMTLRKCVSETAYTWYLLYKEGYETLKQIKQCYNYCIKLKTGKPAHVIGKHLVHYIDCVKPWDSLNDPRSKAWIDARIELKADLDI